MKKGIIDYHKESTNFKNENHSEDEILKFIAKKFNEIDYEIIKLLKLNSENNKRDEINKLDKDIKNIIKNIFKESIESSDKIKLFLEIRD